MKGRKLSVQGCVVDQRFLNPRLRAVLFLSFLISRKRLAVLCRQSRKHAFFTLLALPRRVLVPTLQTVRKRVVHECALQVTSTLDLASN